MEDKKNYGKENEINLKALIALTRSFQFVRKREMRTIKKSGLTISQFGVLEILYHKGNLRISDIIEGTLSTGGNMTVVIDNLEREDLVKRKSDPNDGRASLICITEKGEKHMKDSFPEHVENISEIFSKLTIDEKENLVELLKKLSKA
ncbi:MAG: MarR family transcriptional regulator [Bacillota bacterium]|nr:MarR family transcriptional regulator [Bacillota bacterium]